MRVLLAFSILLSSLIANTSAQETPPPSNDKDQQSSPEKEKKPFGAASLGRLPIEWLIGPYIPIQESLKPLTNKQRGQIYLRQTFLTVGSYVARGFSSGLDQARGEPQQWGGGMSGYGKRYAARYGEFVVQNTLQAGGNALLGYEPRYDFCRCHGFWPRTGHAVSRNFLAYNLTERTLRPQSPTYAAAFVTGMLHNSWLPGRRNIWTGGAYNVLLQAAIGSGYNVVSEFALDILHAFGIKKYDQTQNRHAAAGVAEQ